MAVQDVEGVAEGGVLYPARSAILYPSHLGVADPKAPQEFLARITLLAIM